MEAAYTVIAFC